MLCLTGLGGSAASGAVAAPLRSYTSGSATTAPASGSAVPCGFAGFWAYGKLVPSWTVSTASGSLR